MIRAATSRDVSEVLRLIRALAAYEREPDAVEADASMLHGALFGERPSVFVHLAVDDEDGATVGFALWFVSFSTWNGRHGIWLEDLFVEPEHRGKGYGVALFRHLASICAERGYGRMEWSVLDWNEPALRFYRSVGAEPMDEWRIHRLTGDALKRLGGEGSE